MNSEAGGQVPCFCPSKASRQKQGTCPPASLNGILNILKPPGMTSFDVVGYLRNILKIKKIGHTGTLDPGAVGVLPVCLGNALKAIEYIVEKEKHYRAELTLGVSTDTQDSTGKTIDIQPVEADYERIQQVIGTFIGKIRQVPPMYSAVRVDGKKLYEYARSGITIDRKPRDVEIYSIVINDYKPCGKLILDVICSKGTYIRTLCADIGEKLGCGGHMSFLIRFGTGNFDISSALKLEEVIELVRENRLEEKLIKTETVFHNIKKAALNGTDARKLINGGFIGLNDEKYTKDEMIRVFDEKDNFLALGEVILKDGFMFLKSRKLFI